MEGPGPRLFISPIRLVLAGQEDAQGEHCNEDKDGQRDLRERSSHLYSFCEKSVISLASLSDCDREHRGRMDIALWVHCRMCAHSFNVNGNIGRYAVIVENLYTQLMGRTVDG